MSEGLVVAYCTPDRPPCAQFHICLAEMRDWDDAHEGRIRRGGVVTEISGPRIASARNRLVAAMLAVSDAEWLLMLDTDMVFAPDLAERLLAEADRETAPIVGGLCFVGGVSGQIRPSLAVMTQNDPPIFETVWNYPKDAMVGVDNTGAACLVVHRDVLTEMERRYGDSAQPWFAESHFGKLEYGEDVTFCMRARALGFPIHVNTAVKVGHMKMGVIDEDSYLEFRRGITAEGEDEYMARQRARQYMGA